MTFQFVNRLISDCRGNITTMFALSLPILIFGVGIAVDFGKATQVRTKMDGAADAAAIAALTPEMLHQSNEAAQNASANMFQGLVHDVYGLAPGGATTKVTVSNPDGDTQIRNVTVCYTASTQTPFAAIVGVSSQQIGNCATATSGASLTSRAMTYGRSAQLHTPKPAPPLLVSSGYQASGAVLFSNTSLYKSISTGFANGNYGVFSMWLLCSPSATGFPKCPASDIANSLGNYANCPLNCSSEQVDGFDLVFDSAFGSNSGQSIRFNISGPGRSSPVTAAELNTVSGNSWPANSVNMFHHLLAVWDTTGSARNSKCLAVYLDGTKIQYTNSAGSTVGGGSDNTPSPYAAWQTDYSTSSASPGASGGFTIGSDRNFGYASGGNRNSQGYYSEIYIDFAPASSPCAFVGGNAQAATVGGKSLVNYFSTGTGTSVTPVDLGTNCTTPAVALGGKSPSMCFRGNAATSPTFATNQGSIGTFSTGGNPLVSTEWAPNNIPTTPYVAWLFTCGNSSCPVTASGQQISYGGYIPQADDLIVLTEFFRSQSNASTTVNPPTLSSCGGTCETISTLNSFGDNAVCNCTGTLAEDSFYWVVAPGNSGESPPTINWAAGSSLFSYMVTIFKNANSSSPIGASTLTAHFLGSDSNQNAACAGLTPSGNNSLIVMQGFDWATSDGTPTVTGNPSFAMKHNLGWYTNYFTNATLWDYVNSAKTPIPPTTYHNTTSDNIACAIYEVENTSP